MSFTKHPTIVFLSPIPLDGSRDRAIAEAAVAAVKILDQHLTPAQRETLGCPRLALPVAVTVRSPELFSELVNAEEHPRLIESSEDMAANMQGRASSSSCDPAKGAEIPSLAEAASDYRNAYRIYSQVVKPAGERREIWETYWAIVDSFVKSKRMLELAAQRSPDA